MNQLRELAQLNGTFRDFENQVRRHSVALTSLLMRAASRRSAKTAETLDIASTTARSSETTPPASFAGSAGKQVTWLGAFLCSPVFRV